RFREGMRQDTSIEWGEVWPSGCARQAIAWIGVTAAPKPYLRQRGENVLTDPLRPRCSAPPPLNRERPRQLPRRRVSTTNRRGLDFARAGHSRASIGTGLLK